MQALRLLRWIINFIVDVILLIVLARFLLEFFSANEGNMFVQWVIALSHPFVSPFANVFPATTFGGLVIDWSLALAMAAYGIAAAIIFRILDALILARAPRAADKSADVLP